MTKTVILDAAQPNLVHTRLDCNHHVGLLELIEQQFGGSPDYADELEEAAFHAGLIVPAEWAEHARPCPHCTLVAAPYWLAAA
ncbi:MAG: hypothetical protein WCC60_22230 [Ilumatobacteraceae bacterium]